MPMKKLHLARRIYIKQRGYEETDKVQCYIVYNNLERLIHIMHYILVLLHSLYNFVQLVQVLFSAG